MNLKINIFLFLYLLLSCFIYLFISGMYEKICALYYLESMNILSKSNVNNSKNKIVFQIKGFGKEFYSLKGMKPIGVAIFDDLDPWAIIKVRKEDNLYRIGDTIQSFTIVEISREKVVLDEGHNPTDIRITLRGTSISQGITDLESLMNQAQIKPQITNGVPKGFALFGIKPESIFWRMGLRNGDLITGVNGTKLTSTEEAFSLFDNLKSLSNFSLQLKRRGKEMQIKYLIR